MDERIVVVGASLAGLRAAQGARAAGFDGELVVVGEEGLHPYTRPPLSKEVLLGTQTTAECALPPGSLEAEWRLGTRAVGLDRGSRSLLLAGDEQLGYGRLVVATGLRARPWPGPGRDLRGVYTLRTIEDAAALAAELSPGRRLVIVGAGFIGCEVAASARRLGVDVTMLAADPHPMLPFGTPLGRWCEELHRGHGVDVRCGCEVVALTGEETVRAVELGDGSTVAADAVLVAIGAVPNTEWLAGSGLGLDPAVVCDETLTSCDDPDVLAAGDVASFPDPFEPGSHQRIEHWTVAGELGRLAGRNAVEPPARRAPYAALPYVWSDQYDVKFQAVGYPQRADRFVVAESAPDGGRFVTLGVEDDRVVAAIAVNAAKRMSWYRRLLPGLTTLEEVQQAIDEDASWLGPPLEVMA